MPPAMPVPNYVLIDMNDSTLVFEQGEGPPEAPPFHKQKMAELMGEERKPRYMLVLGKV